MMDVRALFFCVLLGAVLCSCTMQRRLYRPGIYISRAGPAVAEVRKDAEKQTTRLQNKSKPTVLPKAQQAGFDVHEKHAITASATAYKIRKLHQPGRQVVRSPQKILVHKMERALYEDVIPNHVAKAAFRMMLISFGLLCAAFLVYAAFPELVYVTFILLIATLVYALVSLVTSVNARRDQIANDESWLRIALLALIISILIICLSLLLFILLF